MQLQKSNGLIMIKKVIFFSLVAAFFAGLHSNDIECTLCLDIVSAVEAFLIDGATQDDIIEWAEQVNIVTHFRFLWPTFCVKYNEIRNY